MTPRMLPVAWVLLAVLTLTGCKSAYYGTWEKLGYHKRDILVERVEEARDAQNDAKEQFTTALERFQQVVKVDGGELEARYKALQADLTRSESRAKAVRGRIESVETVAKDLFAEWESELKHYNSPDLRRRSEELLDRTRGKYEQMIVKMKRAEGKMEPVLVVFRDQVQFLKHNLNARALASLEGVAAELDKEVAALVRDMEASINEANAFIQGLE